MTSLQCHNYGKIITESENAPRDLVGHIYCCLEHKWESVYIWDCGRCSQRPTVPGSWAWVTKQVYDRDKGTCRCCHKPLDRYNIVEGHKCEYHHIIPVIIGGNSLPENIILLFHECHVKVHSALRGRASRHLQLNSEEESKDSILIEQTSISRYQEG